MLSRGFRSETTVAENAVLDEISHVLAGHLECWRTRRRNGDPDATSPVLIQIDGPGRSLFLDKLAGLLDPDALPEARRFGALAGLGGLDADAIDRFTNPIDVLPVPAPPARHVQPAAL